MDDQPNSQGGQDDESALRASSGTLLSDDPIELADHRDGNANERDLVAEARDGDAEARDRAAKVRDDNPEDRDIRPAEQPDDANARRTAALDREAAARDRAAADSDRQLARAEREASRWNRAVAHTVEADLRHALATTDEVADATLLIGQAQGLIMADLGGDATDALIELGNRAKNDQVALQEAARRTISGTTEPKVADRVARAHRT